ncbi:uracil-DNA glycosylase family protein [Hellea balneolensis]|uniref:uracil-DNA glycosylase family protein n=1 Tax=Hellea balneolensis TaxID=287478 RepID=UPI000413394B|nr:uracil-DNA glycosylase family protein [Hellea balneolensis]
MRLLSAWENIISTQAIIENLKAKIRQCDVCSKAASPIPVTPNPILQGNHLSKIRIIGQAPGTLAHASGRPFTDPSGARLRDWLGVTETEFYNEDLFAVTPMGFCFPGQDDKGGDLPPRKECAPLWQASLNKAFTEVELTLLVGMYAVKEYLGDRAQKNLTETVRHWRDYGPDLMPMPHPSWRNNGWIKRHGWFAEELTELKSRVRSIIDA